MIDVKYKGQVIGVRRGAAEIKEDSLRAIQIMKSMIANAQKRSSDSSSVQLQDAADDNHAAEATPQIYESPVDPITNDPQELNDKSAASSNEQNANPEHSQTETHNNTAPAAPSSIKKQDPAKVKKGIIKSSTTREKKAAKEKPRAVMPSKSDYEN